METRTLIVFLVLMFLGGVVASIFANKQNRKKVRTQILKILLEKSILYNPFLETVSLDETRLKK